MAGRSGDVVDVVLPGHFTSSRQEVVAELLPHSRCFLGGVVGADLLRSCSAGLASVSTAGSACGVEFHLW